MATFQTNNDVYFRWWQKIERMRDIRALVNLVGEAWAEECRRLCPVQQPVEGGAQEGGALRDSIRWVPEGTTGGYIEMLKYGQYVVSGHGEFTEYPTHKAALAFYWPKLSTHEVLAHVTIPAQAPNDFVQRAWQSRRVQETIESLPIRITRRVS